MLHHRALGHLLANPNFTPLRLPGLKLWHDATRITGLSDGASVAQWDDLSGNGNHATQSTAAAKPTYKTGILNDRPVVRFDGGDGLVQAAALSGAMTVFIVYKVTTLTAGNFSSLLTLKNADFSEWIISNAMVGYQDVSWRNDFTASGNGVGMNKAYDTNAHIFRATYNGGTNSDPASYTGARDGSGTVVASDSFGRTATDVGSIGGRIDNVGAVSVGLNGDLGEILVYNRVLPDAQWRRVDQYLGRKWGITITW